MTIIAFLGRGVGARLVEPALERVVQLGQDVERFESEDALLAWPGAATLEILISMECSPRLLSALPRLREIVNPIIGCDQIDMMGAGSRGVVVRIGAVRENYEAMAEATFMMMLAALYDLPGAQAALSEQARAIRRAPRMLAGKTIGLIGWGRIGRAFARRLQGWEVELCVHSRTPDLDQSGVEWLALDTLLRRADLLVVLCPLTSETNGLIGKHEVALLRRGAILINTARGGIVDEAALYEAAAVQHLSAIALDVFEQEPLPIDSPLRGLSNAILTPHSVGHTEEGAVALREAVFENVLAALENGREGGS